MSLLDRIISGDSARTRAERFRLGGIAWTDAARNLAKHVVWLLPAQKRAVLAYQFSYCNQGGSDKVYAISLSMKFTGMMQTADRDEPSAMGDLILAAQWGRLSALINRCQDRAPLLIAADDALQYKEVQHFTFSIPLSRMIEERMFTVPLQSRNIKARELMAVARGGKFTEALLEMSNARMDHGYHAMNSALHSAEALSRLDALAAAVGSRPNDQHDRSEWNMSPATFLGGLSREFTVSEDTMAMGLDVLATLASVPAGTPEPNHFTCMPVTRRSVEARVSGAGGGDARLQIASLPPESPPAPSALEIKPKTLLEL